LETVTHGAAVVNRLIGTAIPFEPTIPGLAENLRPDALADPDHYYAQIMAALFGRSFAIPQEFDGLFACYGGLTKIGGLFDSWTTNALRYSGFDEDELIAAARRRFVLHQTDILDSFSQRNFVSLKINHFQWEYVAGLGLSAAAEPQIRDFGLDGLRDSHRSLFDDLLVLAMRRLESGPCCFKGPGHALGLGLSNGDTTFEEDLEKPLHPVPRSAITGLLAFFDGYAPEVTVHAADAAAIKNVFWTGGLDRLTRLASEAANSVVFIVPPHLAGIALRPPAPPQDLILVPGIYAHELWPTVMAGVAGQLTEILDRHRRIGVFMQAGAMTIPIGALIHLLLSELPDHSVHCFDFGQILDVAVYPSQSGGPWIRKPDVAAAIAGQPIPFTIIGD
jgi:hypothetical protein